MSESVYTPLWRRFTSERAQDKHETLQLYQRVQAAYAASPWGSDGTFDDIGLAVLDEIGAEGAKRDMLRQCLSAVMNLERSIFFPVAFPANYDTLTIHEQVQLRQNLRAQEHFLANDNRIAQSFMQAAADLLKGIAWHLPPISDEPSIFFTPLHAAVRDIKGLIDTILGTVCRDELQHLGIFTALQQRLFLNVCNANGVGPDTDRRLKTAADFTAPPEELIRMFLGGTPFADLMYTDVPFAIPERIRFEHQWIVAPQGSGKTQTLQALILNDLAKVASGDASVVVMDSQGDLIKNIAGLELFAPGQPLHDKLIIIEPDIERPISINPFEIGKHLGDLSPRDKERLTLSALELLDYVFDFLLGDGAALTAKQQSLYRYALRALMHIENATIHDFIALMMQDGDKAYAEKLRTADDTVRSFFETQFNDPKYKDTKQQLMWRLQLLIENKVFERMFASPKSTINLFQELNSAKVVLINTDKELLKDERTEMFGRFFTALLVQVSQERASLARSNRLPTYLYIDEAHDYYHRDSKIATILDQARKMNIGVVLAHQRVNQIKNPSVIDAFSNCGIKFARGTSDAYLARVLQASPEFINSQPDRTFAVSVRGMTHKAISLSVPFFVMEDMPRMSAPVEREVRRRIRDKYASPPQLPAPEPAPEASPRSNQPRPKKPQPQKKPPQSTPTKGAPPPKSTKEW